ncbi:hypothetical protein HWV62_1336 [Athelia sp. TMB]|nr:hypothetical protein HWV62_1336 [Athelia sp. TMB]
MSGAQSSLPQQQHLGNLVPGATQRKYHRQKFVADLSQCLLDFVIQLLPTAEEMAVKEDVRKLLERLIRTIEPDSRLLSFGSTANGFSLRNSDMDLCCLIDSDERLAAADLVTMLGDLLERETKFHVKPLPHARIPIVKLSLDPSPGLPLGIACDIGFENRLALENTRLLMCYAMVDPTRVRTMVLFLKVWSKRRKINSPYQGTLSSYGYVLLVIYFLVHVKNPPVLPNLQQMPPLRPISKEETHVGGHNTWFFDDIELLRQRWQSANTESVAELLIEFFRYYSRDFSYNTGVASIRAGLLKKESKGWQNDLSSSRFHDSRERNRLCIEDPFEIDFNVSRCVTKDGLYTIRGEFMRASRILATRPERAIVALAQLCEERKEDPAPTSPPPSIFIPPRLSSIPPQTPYTVGSSSGTKGIPSPEHFSPASKPGDAAIRIEDPNRPPPEHMAPKRSEWTSPPPPEASSADHTSFENQLGLGLELATSSTEARERQESYASSSTSSTTSEVFSDEEPRSDTDDVRSVHSFTEGASPSAPAFHRPSWHLHGSDSSTRNSPSPRAVVAELPGNLGQRGRFARPADIEHDPRNVVILGQAPNSLATPYRSEANRRSISGPPRALNRLSWPSTMPVALVTPLPPSPSHSGAGSPVKTHQQDVSTVYYETGSRQSPVLYSTSPGQGRQSPIFPYQQRQYHMALGGSNPPSSTPSRNSYRAEHSYNQPRSPITPTTTPGPSYNTRPTHQHTQSNATITAPSPRPHISQFTQNYKSSSSSSSPAQSRSQSRSPLSSINIISPGHRHQFADSPHSPLASTSCGSGSTTPSSTGYATSVSASPPSSSSEEDLAKTKYSKGPHDNFSAMKNLSMGWGASGRAAPLSASQYITP